MLLFKPRTYAFAFRSRPISLAPAEERTCSHAPAYDTSSPPNSALKKPRPCHGWLGSALGGGTPHRSKSLQPASAANDSADHQARSLPISSLCVPLRPANRL